MTFPKYFAAALKFRHLNFLKYSMKLHHIVKDRPKLYKKKYFHGDDVIDDVTGRPQTRPSIFPYKWKMNFCCNNWTNIRDSIIILSVCMSHWVVNMRIWLIMDKITDDVIRPPNKSKLWTAIALSIFELERRPNAQNVTNAHGYLRIQLLVSFPVKKFVASSKWRPF